MVRNCPSLERVYSYLSLRYLREWKEAIESLKEKQQAELSFQELQRAIELQAREEVYNFDAVSIVHCTFPN